jgi:predicted dehydrogenase
VTTLRAAVAGTGFGRRHIQAYQTLPDVQVTAVVSRDPARRAQVQQEYGIPDGFGSLGELLAQGEVDLVSLCTPDRLHAEQAIQALAAGKHVYCEKPLATTVEDAARVVEKVEQTGLTLMAGHNFRFMPQFARLKEQVQAGLLGDLFFGESSYIQDLYAMQGQGPDYWRLHDPQDFFLGGAVHNVDLLRWLVGEVEEVHAYATHVMPFYPLDDTYVCNLHFANGAIGRVLLLLGARLKEKFRVDLNLYGSEGSLRATLQRPEVVQELHAQPEDRPVVVPVAPGDAQAAALAHFVECVRTGQRPLVDVVEGARTVAVCAAAIRSVQEQRPVTVDYSSLNV